MRRKMLLACLLIGFAVPAFAELRVSIGINLRSYPDFVEVPGYPVYYAPESDGNVFFYDGLYWVFVDDRWYSSSWYDGPWDSIEPYAVPLFILRVPVRYYRRPPVFFRGWRADAPPRWGDHWGNSWEQRRRGWDQWNHAAIPARAPLPVYQRNYSGDRYPRADQQRALQQQNYRYQRQDSDRGDRGQQLPQPQQQRPMTPPPRPTTQPQRPVVPPQRDLRQPQTNPRQPPEDRQQQGQQRQPNQPRPQDQRPQQDRPATPRPQTQPDRPAAQRPQPQQDRPSQQRPSQQRPQPQQDRPAPQRSQPQKDRPAPQDRGNGNGKGRGKGEDKPDEPKRGGNDLAT